MEQAKEEAAFLRKYFGLRLELKAKEEHDEENLHGYLNLGKYLFQQLDFSSRATDRFLGLAEGLGFFEFFFIKGEDKSLSPEEIEIRNIELVLGINEILPLDDRGKSLFKKWVGGNKTLRQLSGDYEITKERIRQVLSKRIRQIRKLLYWSTKNRLSYHSLPVDWPQREIFITDEETTVDLGDGRIVPVWSLFKNSDRNKPPIVLSVGQNGKKTLVFAVAPPADKVSLELRSAAWFCGHKWPTLTKILKGVNEEEGLSIRLRSGWSKGFDESLIEHLEKNGVRVYEAKSGRGFSHYIDPQAVETAKNLIKSFYSPS